MGWAELYELDLDLNLVWRIAASNCACQPFSVAKRLIKLKVKGSSQSSFATCLERSQDATCPRKRYFTHANAQHVAYSFHAFQGAGVGLTDGDASEVEEPSPLKL